FAGCSRCPARTRRGDKWKNRCPHSNRVPSECRAGGRWQNYFFRPGRVPRRRTGRPIPQAILLSLWSAWVHRRYLLFTTAAKAQIPSRDTRGFRNTPEDSASQAQPGAPANARHPQAVRKHTRHFRHAMDAFLIVHGHLHDFEVQLTGAKQKLVVAPEILDTPTPEQGLHAQPVLAPEHLRAAERIFDALVQQERKQQAEEFVADHVCKL